MEYYDNMNLLFFYYVNCRIFTLVKSSCLIQDAICLYCYIMMPIIIFCLKNCIINHNYILRIILDFQIIKFNFSTLCDFIYKSSTSLCALKRCRVPLLGCAFHIKNVEHQLLRIIVLLLSIIVTLSPLSLLTMFSKSVKLSIMSYGYAFDRWLSHCFSIQCEQILSVRMISLIY